jgi:hypothetical protein
MCMSLTGVKDGEQFEVIQDIPSQNLSKGDVLIKDGINWEGANAPTVLAHGLNEPETRFAVPISYATAPGTPWSETLANGPLDLAAV